MKNYYDILGINNTATKEEIKSAYRKLSMKMHPDKNVNDSFFSEFFKTLNEANEILSDGLKRQEYDRKLYLHENAERELKKKEEEFKRQKEEYLRNLRQKAHQTNYTAPNPTQPAVYIKEPKPFNWRITVNLLVLLNLFIISLFFVVSPSGKSEYVVKSVAETEKPKAKKNIEKKTKKLSPVKTKQIINENEDEEESFTEQTLIDQQQPKATIEQETVTEQPQIVQPDLEQQEKPGWIQFRKRKEWKKLQREIADSIKNLN